MPRRRLYTVCALALLGPLYHADACSVCFGDPNSFQTAGMTMAILTLLGVTVFVLGTIGVSAYVLAGRAREAGSDHDAEDVPLEMKSHHG